MSPCLAKLRWRFREMKECLLRQLGEARPLRAIDLGGRWVETWRTHVSNILEARGCQERSQYNRQECRHSTMMVGMRLIFRGDSTGDGDIQLRGHVLMPIIVMPPMQGGLPLLMMCAVRTGSRPGGL